MSLDVYLIDCDEKITTCECDKCGNTHEHKLNETLYSANITHNLTRMADECGIYDCLWRPDENGISIAEQLIIPLTNGLELLLADPEKYKKFNATNGWGMYEHFVKFVAEYLEACSAFPLAKVEVSR